ncbi:hypothetical protein BVI2075_480012 [Burkholderia vietnamiensis]|nr:hypothetical protein BVI2075_480012 [Burkholderia vietnamiensis]
MDAGTAGGALPHVARDVRTPLRRGDQPLGDRCADGNSHGACRAQAGANDDVRRGDRRDGRISVGGCVPTRVQTAGGDDAGEVAHASDENRGAGSAGILTDGATIRNVGELAGSIESGACSQRLEVLLDSIAQTCGIAVERARPVEVDDGGPAPIRLGNKTISRFANCVTSSRSIPY